MQLKNLYYATNDGLFYYDLDESNKYFLWINQILFDLTKHFGLCKKMIWLDQVNFFLGDQ